MRIYDSSMGQTQDLEVSRQTVDLNQFATFPNAIKEQLPNTQRD